MKRKDQNILKKYLNIAKSKNYYAKIQGRFLIINNEKYTIEKLKNTDYEDDINTENSRSEKSASAPDTPTIFTTENIFLEDTLSRFTIQILQSKPEQYTTNHQQERNNDLKTLRDRNNSPGTIKKTAGNVKKLQNKVKEDKNEKRLGVKEKIRREK